MLRAIPNSQPRTGTMLISAKSTKPPSTEAKCGISRRNMLRPIDCPIR
jgi:hypothetical protein